MVDVAASQFLLAPLGAVIVALILWDAFETMVLPRRVDRNLRLARFFYRATWTVWRPLASRSNDLQRRESMLAVFGPLSILLLFAVWAGGLIVGFALLIFVRPADIMVGSHSAAFGTTVYLSGTTFFTLGIGDVVPTTGWARGVTVLEAGMGFAFLALVMGYLPVLYQAFSRREMSITLLDARAGSPPSSGEMLRRFRLGQDDAETERLLIDWERWAADLLEMHLSYPVLAYFRSQHDRQSWLAALTAMLDFCAIVVVYGDDRLRHQGQLTFAMARHTVVDLAQIFRRELREPAERLPDDDYERLEDRLRDAGLELHEADAKRAGLAALRQMYEAYLEPLSELFLMPLPPWIAAVDRPDDWRTSDRESVLP